MSNRIYFNESEPIDFIEIKVTRTQESLNKIVRKYGDPGKDCLACCCYNHASAGPNRGFLIFTPTQKRRDLLAHECTHAALLFTQYVSMKSPQVQAMEPNEQQAYYEECVAQIVESLFRQSDKILFG